MPFLPLLLLLACSPKTADDDDDDDAGDGGSSDGGSSDGGSSDGGSSDGGSSDGGSSDGGSGDGGSGDGGSTSSNGFFAPFVDATLYPTLRLADVADEVGITRFALGFIVAESPSSCTPSWGGYYDVETGPVSWGDDGEYTLYEQIAGVRDDHGGDVIVSFGGAAGTPLASACTDVDDLVAAYRQVVDALELTEVDFDIEGAWLADHREGGSAERRARAVAQLQDDLATEGRHLDVWLTLPVLPSGLTADGEETLTTSLMWAMELTGLNIMTMDYGDGAAPDPDGRMGEYGIEALEATHDQLDTILSRTCSARPAGSLYSMLGTTPMIGLNDVTTETFYLEDAEQTRAFAEDVGLGMLSFWSLNRDHPCPEKTWVGLTCSSSPDQTEDWEFSQVFLGYGG